MLTRIGEKDSAVGQYRPMLVSERTRLRAASLIESIGAKFGAVEVEISVGDGDSLVGERTACERGVSHIWAGSVHPSAALAAEFAWEHATLLDLATGCVWAPLWRSAVR